jgi:hypothetical protein
MVLETAISDDLQVQYTTMVVKSLYPHRYLFMAIDVSKTTRDQDIGLIDRLLRIDLSDLCMVLAPTIGAPTELRTMILGFLHRMLSAAEIMALGLKGCKTLPARSKSLIILLYSLESILISSKAHVAAKR